MSREFWLGALLGLVLSVFANLLTPLAEPYWRRLITLLRHGRHAQTRQQIRAIQIQLDGLLKRQADSGRDLFIYILRWGLCIFTLAAFSAVCIFIARTAPDITPLSVSRLLLASEASLIGSLVVALVLLLETGHSTEAGLQKRILKLQSDIVKLNATLPPSA
jgi:hypothetical protein